MTAPEHPCAGACIGCGASSEEACYPPCRCDVGDDCAASIEAMSNHRKPAAFRRSDRKTRSRA